VRGGEVFVKCFSEHCQDTAAKWLGSLHADVDTWSSLATRIDMQYLTWPPVASADASLLETAPTVPVDRAAVHAAALDDVVRAWGRGEFKALGIKSAMGTGKTTLVRSLLTELFPGRTVLVVTYRQTLAHESVRKLGDLGFVNYMDVNGPLDDREQYPRVVCQIESLPRLGKYGISTPKFDLVILDEIESVLRHFGSPTIPAPVRAMRAFVDMLLAAPCGVLSMDADWGNSAHAILDKCGLGAPRVVVNDRPGPKRSYVFDDDEKAWQERIRADLVDRQWNVVVVSMSTDAIQRLLDYLEREHALDVRQDVLVHTSKADDALKEYLRDVDASWTRFRLVAYSPHVEAGIDCSAPWFNTMHCYCCRLSTTPWGFKQMTGRVRQLTNPEVHCCAPQGLLRGATDPHPRLTVQDARTYVKWLLFRLQRLPVVGESVRGEGDAVLPLPPCDVLLELEAHNEAAKANSSLRFFAELRQILEAAGHEVRVESSDAGAAATASASTSGQAPSKAPQPVKVGRMLTAAACSENEFAALRSSVYGNRASEDDKWRYHKALYCRAWGVDRVDAAFLEQNSTDLHSPHTMQVIRMVYPMLFLRDGAAPTQSKSLARSDVIAEVIRAMGFQGPFDTKHVVVVKDLKELYDAKLKDTTFFKHYDALAKDYKWGMKAPAAWTNKSLREALDMVFGACGLGLKTTRNRKKIAGKMTDVGAEYRLDPDKVAQMAELVKLKTRRAVFSTTVVGCKHTHEHLQALELKRYGHLVDPEASAREWMGCLSEDDDM
jgi:hypothetical protein